MYVHYTPHTLNISYPTLEPEAVPVRLVRQCPCLWWQPNSPVVAAKYAFPIFSKSCHKLWDACCWLLTHLVPSQRWPTKASMQLTSMCSMNVDERSAYCMTVLILALPKARSSVWCSGPHLNSMSSLFCNSGLYFRLFVGVPSTSQSSDLLCAGTVCHASFGLATVKTARDGPDGSSDRDSTERPSRPPEIGRSKPERSRLEVAKQT